MKQFEMTIEFKFATYKVLASDYSQTVLNEAMTSASYQNIILDLDIDDKTKAKILSFVNDSIRGKSYYELKTNDLLIGKLLEKATIKYKIEGSEFSEVSDFTVSFNEANRVDGLEITNTLTIV